MKENSLENNEEYLKIILRLEEISNYSKLLKQMEISKIYNAHLVFPGTFSELIININRDNSRIDQEINNEKRKVLINITNPHCQSKIKNELDIIINLLNISIANPQKQNIDLNNKLLNDFVNNVKNLLLKKFANNMLLNEIINLEEEQEKLWKRMYINEDKK